jgi:adenosylmethionine-8-amino-7-oxononanoate aminotransferase
VRHDDLQALAHEHLLLHFASNGSFGPEAAPLLVLERGEGCHVYDTTGRRHVDGLSSLFCAQLGYSYGAEIAEAASAQLRTLTFNTNYSTAHPPAIDLAARLAELAPGDLNKVFFTSGGSESVDSAWKMARLFHVANGQPERTKAIARRGAYHGVTIGALALTGIPGAKEPFGTPAFDVTHVSNTDAFRAPDGGDPAAFCARLLDEVEAAILAAGPETVGLIAAEPVQNAGGCLVPPPGYWEGLRQIADRYGILLLADEVITAFGRLGEMFGSDVVGAQPDLVTVAKGLTSAHAPMGALLVSDRVAEPLFERGRVLAHGHTFGGHPLSAAIAMKSLDIFERDGVLDNVRALTPHLTARVGALRELPIVGDVRGAGFFWSVELVADDALTPFALEVARRLVQDVMPARLRAHGLIAKPDDRGPVVLTMAPPLVASKDVLDEIVGAMAAVLGDVEAALATDPELGARSGAGVGVS